ncbi:class I SAM-dependent methyltransferase [Streptomyces sp. NPDC056149]|uniref:class I SAM-dependent methyltransferase n=1 Tax=Streptomyces sp. NPDC056149 TaxID=3345728 RepID=UPI0035D661A6
MTDERSPVPDSSAVRVALWRALHVQCDPPPHVLDDEIGLRLAAPDEDWRARPDMDPQATAGFRAAIVARARFIEDLALEQAAHGITQYVILGAGLDTFAQRHPEVAGRLRVFEIDQPATQSWKRRRLIELGYGIPDWLHLVPVDFEANESWPDRLSAAGFTADRPTLIVSTGVTLYLSKDTTAATLRHIARLAPGSTLALSFPLPAELLAPADRLALDRATKGARASGTPFLSFYTPQEMLTLARRAGFADARHLPATALADRYFSHRPDPLRPTPGEDFLLATT